MLGLSEAGRKTIESLGIMTAICLSLLLYRAIVTSSLRYWFIPENLALAWAGLLFGWLLVKGLRSRRWLSWQNILLGALWISSLPNTWYVLTDFIHVYPTGEISEFFDIVLIISLVITGFALGFISLLIVHRELLKRFSSASAFFIVELVILVSSFAIYLGRILRWSSWDVLTNPGGLLLNVSDRVIDPLGHMHALTFTGLFFVLISGLYFAFYRGIQAAKSF